VIGDGCTIEDHAVLGKRPRLARHSSAAGEVRALELGARVSVGTGAVVFAGASVAAEAILGDQTFVRERSSIGAGSVIGRGSVVDNDVQIGARVRVQTNVYLTAFTVIEDDVFVGPGALLTNDDTMARHGPEYETRGATLRRACRVGGGTVLTPGVEIGEEAFVAAGGRDGGAGAGRARSGGRGPARALALAQLQVRALQYRSLAVGLWNCGAVGLWGCGTVELC